MQILFEARSPEALVLRDAAMRRARFVLRRLHSMVLRARVQLDDVNGPRRGVDKRCRVELAAPAGEPLVVTSMATNWHRALDAALARSARALLRRSQRRRARSAWGRRAPPR